MTAPAASERIRAVLGGPDLNWLVQRCRARIEQGRALTGEVTRANATAGERTAVARLLGRPVGSGASLSVRLETLDREIARSGMAPDLRTAVETLTGPLIVRPAVQAAEHEVIASLVAAMSSGPHRDAVWYRAWIESLQADGTLTRLSRRGDLELAASAAHIISRLPSPTLVTLPVLAEHSVGDTKALAATPLARLVLRALARWHDQAMPHGRQAERQLWLRAGVVADDLASQVLVLNLPGHEQHVVARWLREAAEAALPFRLTLHQLDTAPVTPVGPDIYVCENPAVLRIAAAQLGQRCAALVCTEGVPSAACIRILSAAAESGVRLHWHADFDWAGLRMTNDAIRRFGADPWRMSVADYRAGLERGESEPLRGSPATSSWDPELGSELARHGRAVMEERVLDSLLQDVAQP
jgi:uncharacterized protein (TIGR02679 family)